MVYNSYLNDPDKVTITDIPALVKGLRQLLGLSQKQFARELGVSFSTVSHWENALRRPQPARLQRLLEIKTSLSQGSSGRQRGLLMLL